MADVHAASNRRGRPLWARGKFLLLVLDAGAKLAEVRRYGTARGTRRPPASD